MQLSLTRSLLLDDVSSSLKPELYQHLLLILLVIARTRPNHLCLISSSIDNTLKKVVNEGVEPEEHVIDDTKVCSDSEGSNLWIELIDKLNQIFWNFYDKRPSNVNIAPVCNTGKLYCVTLCNITV